jgi:hypothetical protein
VIAQRGVGGGVRVNKSYSSSFEDMLIVNGDLVDFTPGLVRTGTGFDIQPKASGGLITIRKVTSRGFATGFKVCDPTIITLSMLLDQLQCSVVTDGILIGTGGVKTVLDTCYFEGVQEGKCIIDKGRATTVQNCFIYNSSYTVGIDSTYLTEGNLYSGNTIYLSLENQIGIDLFTQGDAPGYSKTVRDNFIYFTASGGSVAGVNGIRLTGANPAANVVGNTFKPRRNWVGGAGTLKINDATTGFNSGVTPLTNALVEVPFYSNFSYGYIPSTTVLTESHITSEELALTVSAWNTLTAAGTVLSGVSITGTAGQFECSATTLTVGMPVVISGTLGGTGSITGYVNPTTYYIIATNGTTTFTLSATFGGTAITTTVGTPTGLTYTRGVRISKINDGNKKNRQVMIENSNTRAILVKGPFMILASNFTGYGCIILQLRDIAGSTYAYELSRTMY